MTKNNLLNQYSWIMKVLSSCENDEQVETTTRLFDLYVNRWKRDLTTKQMNQLISNFEREKKNKSLKSRKKKGNFLSNISQFFIF